MVSGEADDGSNAVLSVITYMSILRFLVGRFREAHELFYKNICELVSLISPFLAFLCASCCSVLALLSVGGGRL